MSPTIETLKEKLMRIERELAEVREALQQLSAAQGDTAQGVGKLPRTIPVADKEKIGRVVDETFEKMGIRGEPVGAEKLQQMMAEHGIKPEDNLFSRGLVEMREE